MPPKCTCPSWWDCPTRGCYEDAKAMYADVSIKRDLARGYPKPRIYEVEYGPMGDAITHHTPKRKD